MNDARDSQRLDALRVAAMVVGLSVALLLLWHTRTLILTVFMGVLFALAVSAGVDRLQRYRVPRGVAAPLIVLAFVGILAGFGTWIGPTVRTQTRELKTKLPEALDKLDVWVHSHGGGIIATLVGADDSTAVAPPTAASDTVTVVPVEKPSVSENLRDRILSQV